MIDLNKILKIKNNQSVSLKDINIFNYTDFYQIVIELLKQSSNYCLSYFAFKNDNDLHFIMAIGDDNTQNILLLSHLLKSTEKPELQSLSKEIVALHIFEREIHENLGINFIEHPWQKPVRFAHNRTNQKMQIADYPFYSIKSEELHEVGVGPIHAGIIEPGHFRFICNGENVLHLEI